MFSRRSVFGKVILLAVGMLALLPAAAAAQASLTGTVRDGSGGVLPGVTVEAASPVLIEGVRTAVTDGSGQYRIVDLRPGLYTVTFTLPGFSVVKRDGVTLSGTAVTSINADLQVGGVAETITVTGEAALVDTQSATRSRIVSSETIDTIPNSRMIGQIANMIPGMVLAPAGAGSTQDVGGGSGDPFTRMAIHGSKVSDQRITIAGVTFGEGNGQTHGMGPNMAAAAEVSIDTSGVDASVDAGGVRMNVIPRDGGNTFRGGVFFSGATTDMQGDNIDDELRRMGILASAPIKTLYDISPSLGGPIVRDRLWFFGTYRRNVAENYVLGLFENATPTAWTYSPTTVQATSPAEFTWASGRFTWQAPARQKIAFSYDYRNKCQCPSIGGTGTAPEASINVKFNPMNLTTVNYTAPLTNRFLLEAGVIHLDALRQHLPVSETSALLNSVTEQRPAPGTPGNYRAATGLLYNEFPTLNTDFKMSYVTGAHQFSTGVQLRRGRDDVTNTPVAPQFTLQNGAPVNVTVFARPIPVKRTLGADMGIYAQDRWTIDRATINAGLRFDYIYTYAPETQVTPTQYTPNVNVTLPKTDLIRWKDISPRLGFVYDLRGDGRTAVRTTLNRYVAVQGANGPGGVGVPANEIQASASRAWTDNGNFIPDCDLTSGAVQDNRASGGDLCGAWTGASVNFGSAVPGTRADPDVAFGWGKREYNWEWSAAVAHQITNRVAVDLAAFRRWYGNFRVTDNLLVGPSDFTSFNLATPSNPGLPGGGGYTVNGLLNLTQAAALRGNQGLLTFSSNFGEQSETWTGFDTGLTVRAANGVTLQGGTSTGRTVTDNCDVIDDVPEASFAGTRPLPTSWCHVENAFLTQVKFQGSYRIPRVDVQFSATYQNSPGPEVQANEAVANAVIRPVLGRDLSGGAQTLNITYLEPGTVYGDRLNQVDLRMSKILRFGTTRSTISLDLYNLTNANTYLAFSTNYSQFMVPTSILQPRLIKVTAQLDF